MIFEQLVDMIFEHFKPYGYDHTYGEIEFATWRSYSS